MAINQNAPFTRVYADIPTPVAVKLEDPQARGGKSKKQFIADAIEAAVNASAPAPAAPAKKSRK
jgi:hypothetical protein